MTTNKATKTATTNADSGDTTKTEPARKPIDPDVLEARVFYTVARRDLYLADNLTRSA